MVGGLFVLWLGRGLWEVTIGFKDGMGRMMQAGRVGAQVGEIELIKCLLALVARSCLCGTGV